MFDWKHEMWDREWKSPRNGDRGRWYLPNEDVFHETVITLGHEYGMPILGSPSYIGLEVLRNIHREQGKKIEPLSLHQRMDFQQYAKQMCHWMSWSKWTNRKPGLTEQQKSKRYIVGYDKNGQFLGASGSVELGNGGYQEVGIQELGIHSLEVPNSLPMGFWQYELLDVSSSLFNGENLPCPLDCVKGIAHTDLILACIKCGLELTIKSGITWEKSEKYLARWAKEMWQHRVNMKKIEDAIVRRNCEGTAKHIPNTMVGRFAHESSGEYFHPDWNRAIVHRSISNLTYTLAKIKRETDLTPILVSKDALYFATDENEPALAVPNMLDYQFEQRGWKPIGVCNMTAEIVDSFAQRKVEVTEQLIKKEMKAYGATTTV